MPLRVFPDRTNRGGKPPTECGWFYYCIITLGQELRIQTVEKEKVEASTNIPSLGFLVGYEINSSS